MNPVAPRDGFNLSRYDSLSVRQWSNDRWERYRLVGRNNQTVNNYNVQQLYPHKLYRSRNHEINGRKGGIWNYQMQKSLPACLEDKAQKLETAILNLKEELQEEKKRRTLLIKEKLKLKETLKRRALLAESANSFKEEEFKWKKMKLLDKIQLKDYRIEHFNWKLKDSERDLSLAIKSRDELSSILEELLKNPGNNNTQLKREKQSFINERTNLELDRTELWREFEELSTKVSNMEKNIVVKDEEIFKLKNIPRQYFEEKSLFKDTTARRGSTSTRSKFMKENSQVLLEITNNS